MKINRKLFIGSVICFIAFMIFTFLVENVGVMQIGPQSGEVGFATINKSIADNLPYNEMMYDINKGLGYWAILTVAIFVLFSIMQLFIRKGFLKIDKDLFILCGMYIGVFLSYIIFDKVIINYGPIILKVEPEASYPASNIMMSVAFMLAAIQQFSMRLKKESTRKKVIVICGLVMIGIIVTCILSGVYWMTDIIGALLLSAAWFLLYFGAIKTIYPNK